jgi:hypothetical protein
MNSRRLSPTSVAEIMLGHARRMMRYGFKFFRFGLPSGASLNLKAPLTSHGATTRRTTLTSSGKVTTENVRRPRGRRHD